MSVKQNKGKDLHKVPKSKLSDGPYYISKKYDGHYIQIQYSKGEVTMWTSGGKEFYLDSLGNYIKEKFSEDFHIECEYNYNCEGFLGDRGKSAILTRYRTRFEKGMLVVGHPKKDIFRVLDIVDSKDRFDERLNKIVDLFLGLEWFMIPTQIIVPSLLACELIAKRWVSEGYEGGMLKAPNHIYQPGKRVNNIIKIKPRLTADLLCVAWKDGTGKYANMIGALLLEDSKGRKTWAGSGLSDYQREMDPEYFVGQVVEIQYERIDDTYIQPIIKEIRNDKQADEID